jgi:hypothetical protein
MSSVTSTVLLLFYGEAKHSWAPDAMRELRPIGAKTTLDPVRIDTILGAEVIHGIAPNWLRVCASRRSKVAPCCALDEGRPLGTALQEEASNRNERLLPNGNGRERHGQKVRLDCVRYG